jgi:hypothetical protein
MVYRMPLYSTGVSLLVPCARYAEPSGFQNLYQIAHSKQQRINRLKPAAGLLRRQNRGPRSPSSYSLLPLATALLMFVSIAAVEN